MRFLISRRDASLYNGSVAFVSYCLIFPPHRSLQVQVHKKRAKDSLQGCAKAGDQTQTSFLPREDDICHHGERGALQRSGVLSAPQTAEYQKPSQVVPDLEG